MKPYEVLDFGHDLEIHLRYPPGYRLSRENCEVKVSDKTKLYTSQ